MKSYWKKIQSCKDFRMRLNFVHHTSSKLGFSTGGGADKQRGQSARGLSSQGFILFLTTSCVNILCQDQQIDAQYSALAGLNNLTTLQVFGWDIEVSFNDKQNISGGSLIFLYEIWKCLSKTKDKQDICQGTPLDKALTELWKCLSKAIRNQDVCQDTLSKAREVALRILQNTVYQMVEQIPQVKVKLSWVFRWIDE